MTRDYFAKKRFDRFRDVSHSPIRDCCDLRNLRSIDQSLTCEEEAELLGTTSYQTSQPGSQYETSE